ncbi:MAG: stage II sporulation protein R [Clostridia bacterium]|nr:stage II sporulation protein R [Clostridia bacterium]
MSRVLLLIKEFGNNPRNNIKFKTGVALVLALIIITGLILNTYSNEVNEGLADNLIRLHVIANSDSEADQALKRDVRDVIVKYMEDKLKGSKDIEQTKFIINSNMTEINELASSEIQRQGKDYSVKTMLGCYPFPTKVYGDITLPAGNYQALRVVIGKGEGANWWCVLFPPLCFVDATHGTVSESVKQDLKNVLTEEEYNIITSVDDEEDIPIKVKFKIVEFFQDSKLKISSFLSKIF